jgi:hypothetical protein
MRSLVLLSFLTACATSSGDEVHCSGGKCDGPGIDQSCSDPKYGNGTCDLQLSCGVPDIDCFEAFPDDATAATWYATQESWVWMQKGKPGPRTILPTTDPRFAPVRALLDRGWAAFQTHRPVGKLADQRPALVLIDDSEPNAYVIGDKDKQLSAFVVVVQTGLLSVNATDDARLGVMMHELQHAVGLHLIYDHGAQIAKYYAAGYGAEPIGRDQADDAGVRAAVTGWEQGASQVGAYSNVELGGYPISGDLRTVFDALLASGQQNNPTGCANALALVGQLAAKLGAGADPLGGPLVLDASVAMSVDGLLAALRTECLVHFPYSFVDVLAQLKNTTPAAITMAMDPADLALVTNTDVTSAVAALTSDRRAKMRGFETSLPVAWSDARYFSFEEDADDVSLFVLAAANAKPDAVADFFVKVLGQLQPAAGAACSTALAAGQVPPYGVDLTDPHHSTCWRAYHLHELAATGAQHATRIEPGPVVSAAPAIPALPVARATREPID